MKGKRKERNGTGKKKDMESQGKGKGKGTEGKERGNRILRALFKNYKNAVKA